MKNLILILGFSLFSFLKIEAQENWTIAATLPQYSLNSICFTNATTGYAVGNSGIILKTTNGGTSWAMQTSGTQNALLSIFFPTASTGYAVGSNIILKTTNAGASWASSQPGKPAVLFSVHFINVDTGYATGSPGIFMKTENAGTSWILSTLDSSSSTNSFLNSVRFLNSKTGYITGLKEVFVGDELIRNYDVILKTSDGGASWATIRSQLDTILQPNSIVASIRFPNANMGYALSALELVRTTNDGSTWSNSLLNSTIHANVLCFPSPDSGYAFGNGGVILKTTNAGGSWIPQPSPTTSNVVDAYFVDQNLGYTLGSGGVILKKTGTTSILGGKAFRRSILETYPSDLTSNSEILLRHQGKLFRLNGREPIPKKR